MRCGFPNMDVDARLREQRIGIALSAVTIADHGAEIQQFLSFNPEIEAERSRSRRAFAHRGREDSVFPIVQCLHVVIQREQAECNLFSRIFSAHDGLSQCALLCRYGDFSYHFNDTKLRRTQTT